MKRFLAALLVLVMMVSLCACGSSAAGTEAKAEPEPTPAATPEPTPEPTSEPTPESTPEPLPFAEEHGFIFEAPHEITKGGTQVVYFNNTVVGEIPVTAKDYPEIFKYQPTTQTMHQPTIVCSEPDEEGFVTYTITEEVETEVAFLAIPGSLEASWSRCNAECSYYSLYDYYTGIEIPNRHLSGNDDYGVDVVIEYQGNQWPVSTQINSEWKWGEWIYQENGASEFKSYEVPASGQITETIRVPADYDGLILGYLIIDPDPIYDPEKDLETDTSEVLEYEELKYWGELDEDDDPKEADPANWTFIRVSDYAVTEG